MDIMTIAIPITWNTIFHLPTSPALIVYPSAAAILRNPVTANSRLMMMITIHPASSLISTSETNAAEIKSLSAIGSSSVPTVVTCFHRRARYPSNKSVIAAARKIPNAKKSLATTTREFHVI